MSGFIPASTDARRHLVYGNLAQIKSMIIRYWCVNNHALPMDWDSIERANREIDFSQCKDPFSDGGKEFHRVFSEGVSIIWSVGPDAIDDLKVTGERVHGKDELVLVVVRANDQLKTKAIDLSGGHDANRFVMLLTVNTGPDECTGVSDNGQE
jgi:hypothetical protein